MGLGRGARPWYSARVSAFRQPAEWTPHAATWVAWPSAADLWQDNLSPAQMAFTAMCTALADVDRRTGLPRGEKLHVLVADADAEALAKAALGPLGATFHRVPFGDIWLRDTAPIFVSRRPRPRSAAARFGFNGWGGKYVLPHDDEVAARIAMLAGHQTIVSPLVLEGGSVEVDGEGTCLTTRQCLLNPNRNPGMSATAIEQAVLARRSAVRSSSGSATGSSTTTPTATSTPSPASSRPGVVVCMEAHGRGRPEPRGSRRDRRETSQAMTDAHGRQASRSCASPPRAASSRPTGASCPRATSNFYIGNTHGRRPHVRRPRRTTTPSREVAALFPGRRTVGVDARAILSGGGAFHCITQQEPRAGLPAPER